MYVYTGTCTVVHSTSSSKTFQIFGKTDTGTFVACSIFAVFVTSSHNNHLQLPPPPSHHPPTPSHALLPFNRARWFARQIQTQTTHSVQHQHFSSQLLNQQTWKRSGPCGHGTFRMHGSHHHQFRALSINGHRYHCRWALPNAVVQIVPSQSFHDKMIAFPQQTQTIFGHCSRQRSKRCWGGGAA